MDKLAFINMAAEWEWVTDLKEGISNSVNGIGDNVKGAIDSALSGLGNAITTAIKESLVNVSKWIVLGVIDNSLWICLGFAMGGLVLYIGGWKKGAKVTTISLVVFVLLQAIGSVIR